MNRLIIKALKGVFISCFMLILLISLVQAVEHPPPKNSSVLSYGITFFSITPDFKSDISIHLSILPFDKHFADKARFVTINLFDYIDKKGYVPINGILLNPNSKKIDVDIIQTTKGILVKINKYREDGLILEKLFTDESAEDIAFDISCQLFGRGI